MSFSVRFASVFGLTAVMVGVNVAQVSSRPPRPAAPQDAHPEVATWRLSKTSALKVAAQTDAHIAALRKYECEAEMLVAMPGRKGSGGMKVVSKVQDSTMYSIQFPAVSLTREKELRKVRVRADGKISELLEPRLPKAVQKPIGQLRIVKNATPADWAMGHPGYIFGPVLGETPFTNLVRQAAKPGSGYKVVLQERMMRRLNKPNPQYRITVERTPTAAKKYGPMHVDAIIDATLWLPVTIFGTSDPNGKKVDEVQVGNRITWKVRRKPFDPSDFRLKNRSGASNAKRPSAGH